MPIMIAIPTVASPWRRRSNDWSPVRSERPIVPPGAGRGLCQIEREVGERAAEVERAAHQHLLSASMSMRRRGHRRPRAYAGASGRRSLLHAGGRRGGDAVAVSRGAERQGGRSGEPADRGDRRGWLPETAAAMAHLLQQGPSREASRPPTAWDACRTVAAASSGRSCGGRTLWAKKTEIDDALIVALEIPQRRGR